LSGSAATGRWQSRVRSMISIVSSSAYAVFCQRPPKLADTSHPGSVGAER
jgi:hypothetical protein